MLLDTGQAAARCNLARSTLAKLRVYGGGPAFLKIGAKVLYEEDEIERWLRSHDRRASTSQRALSRLVHGSHHNGGSR